MEYSSCRNNLPFCNCAERATSTCTGIAKQFGEDLKKSFKKAYETEPIQVLEDSGKRMSYGEDAAMREPDDDKVRFDLLPADALERIARHYTNGAKKYAPRNWEKGMPVSRFLQSLMRHLNAYQQGDRSEDHLAAIAFNLMGIMRFENTEWNDL